MSGATWHDTVLAPPLEPPLDHRSTAVNGGQQRSTEAVNDGQRWRTTAEPPVNHRSTVVDHQSTGRSTVGSTGQTATRHHVATRGTTWQLTWLEGILPSADSNPRPWGCGLKEPQETNCFRH
ncbi:hypothetical protein Tco_0223669 [Tanacetum coccineum]